MIVLDERLAAIARMLPDCANVADIGADHGLLGAHLLEAGRCDCVQFLDVSAESLHKARRLIAAMGLEERAVFAVGDGAEALVMPPGAVVVAGMGGETIAGIVARGRQAFGDCPLVLQANVGVAALRRTLAETGYCLEDEEIVRAARRWYVVLKARPGRAAYTEKELLAGPVILARRRENLAGYARFRLRVAEKALAGAEMGNPRAAAEFRREVAWWREILAE